jgi:hypothetical protein
MNPNVKKFLEVFETDNPLFDVITPDENEFIVASFDMAKIYNSLKFPETHMEIVAAPSVRKKLKATMRIWLPAFHKVFGEKVICWCSDDRRRKGK